MMFLLLQTPSYKLELVTYVYLDKDWKAICDCHSAYSVLFLFSTGNKLQCYFILIDYRAKEEAKRIQEQAETEARRRLESEKAETEAKKEAHRKKVEASLPSEPPLDQGDNITKIRVRLPKGEYIERRFQANTPLKVNVVICRSKILFFFLIL